MNFIHRTQKIRAGSDLNASSVRTKSIVPEGATQATNEGNQPIVLPISEVYEPQQQAALISYP